MCGCSGYLGEDTYTPNFNVNDLIAKANQKAVEAGATAPQPTDEELAKGGSDAGATSGGSNLMLYAGIGVGVIVLIIIGVVIYKKSKG